MYLRQFERQRPDAVLLFASLGGSLLEKGAMAWYSRIRGVPALMFPRGGAIIDDAFRSSFVRLWVRLVFGGARKILCQGPAWRRFAVDLLGFAPEDAPIVSNWTATPELLTIGRQRTFNDGGQPVRLLFLGWLEREKGIFELLEVCRRLHGSRQFVLEVVGDGKASELAHRRVAENGLGEIVRFRGWLKQPEVLIALREADVLVLPSWSEGMPNAVIEAMAARLAVVVSAVGTIPDVVVNGREALLVPAQDVAALELALSKVIDDSAFRRNLANAGFSLAANTWGVEQAVDQIILAIESSSQQISVTDKANA